MVVNMLRIAHISKPYLPVPSTKYGAVEKIIQALAEGQAEKHHVTVFATGDSKLSSNVSSEFIFETGLGDRGYDRNIEFAQLCIALQKASKFDIIHVHSIDSALPLAGLLKKPIIFTFHNVCRFETSALMNITNQKYVLPIFLSKAQRDSYPPIHNSRVIPYGLDLKSFPLITNKQDYLVYVGAISPNKGVELAIKVAKKANKKLVIAGKIRDETYFSQIIYPSLDNKQIVFVNELSDTERNELVGKAIALLFPSKWREPFGLVMLESLAVGTPVIALDNGAVQEVLDSSVGVIANDLEDMLNGIDKVQEITPKTCRDFVYDNFNIITMLENYEKAYSKLLSYPKL